MSATRKFALGRLLAFGLCVSGLGGCAVSVGGGGGAGDGDGDDGPGGDQDAELRANFDEAVGGHFAVAEDEDGNEFTFRAAEGDENRITEGTVLMTDGTRVTVALDDQGRPVKFRNADGENADVTYGDEGARIRYLPPGGDPGDAADYQDVSGVDTTNAKARVRAHRAEVQKQRRLMQGISESANISTLRGGLATFEEVTLSLFDGINGNNPLFGTDLEDAGRLLARIATDLGIVEVDREQIDTDLDEIPPTIEELAGQTFVLFEAEGLCVEQADVINRLTFDNFGVMLTEFDRNLVFPDFSFGGATPGFTINYVTGTPVVLTQGQDLEFEATVTPVFTGTQLDGNGNITIERRFLAQITYLVDLFTVTEADTEQLFNAAFINGQLTNGILDLDLILIDLDEETPVTEPLRVRYYRQDQGPPVDRLFPCTVNTGQEGDTGLSCPLTADPFRAFEVQFTPRQRQVAYDFDWFVSDGYGYVEFPETGTFTSTASVVPMDEGPLEVTLIVSHPDAAEGFDLYTCQVRVGEDDSADQGYSCPETLAIGEPGSFSIDADLAEQFVDAELYVYGTSEYEVDADPELGSAAITFWEAGRFEVSLVTYADDGSEEVFYCEVQVVGGAGSEDPCLVAGWYGDGVCDQFCPEPDPDCDAEDWCEAAGWYGDGFCDEGCPEPDPDCEDLCATLEFYGDGTCDEWCPEPDPDCESADECAELGFYGDLFCDEWCPTPDPDCEDFCALAGWYYDGECDEICPQPDPDCDLGTDGLGTDGFGTDGFGTDGFGTDGFGTDGFGTDGFGTDGFGTDGFGTDGL